LSQAEGDVVALIAKPYLREISVDPNADIDLQRYPFTVPAVRELGVIAPHPSLPY
jgi:hypothetical protein